MTWGRRSLIALFVIVGLGVPGASPAQEAMAERIAALTPEIEAYVAKGMADFRGARRGGGPRHRRQAGLR